MKFFKNRAVAIILCVLMVLGSTLLNTRVKFGRQCRNVEQSFYDAGGISEQLELIRSKAGFLADMAEAKGLDTSSLRNASQALEDKLGQRRLDITGIHSCYEALDRELKNVETKLITSSLTDQEAETFSSSLELIHNAQAKLSTATYNETVRSFCRRNDRFPTNILAKLAGVSLPEEFA